MDIIKEFKSVIFGLGYVLLLVAIINLFNLTFWYIYGLVLLGSNIISIWFKNWTIKSFIKGAIQIYLFMITMRWLNQFGVWGYIISIILITVYILWSRWDKYIAAMQHIETQLWGKPLKEFRKEGKKPPNPFF